MEKKNIDIKEHLPYLNEMMKEATHVIGEIYVITNIVNNKQYVGQVRSHRLNSGLYKPFGSTRRLADHQSEARNNTKKKQCTYLNNAIRKHGEDNFHVEIITRCDLSEIDDLETHYIKEYNTMFPNGYNLTTGGRSRKACENTRAKIMNATQKQFADSKLERFKGTKVDINNLDQYLYLSYHHKVPYYRVIIADKKCIFVGRYETQEALKKKAIDFLKTLHQQYCDTTKLRESP